MSTTSTPVTAEHFAYIAARTRQEDAFLKELKAAAERERIPAIWIAPEQASFMQILLRMVRAREVVEVGTLAGYSAICMARALPPGGRVRTIEICGEYARFARQWADRSDVGKRIEILQGAGMEILPAFENDSADAFFIDADKDRYPAYFEEALRIVRAGGLIMADNALASGEILDASGGDPEVVALRRFNDVVAADPKVHGVIVPLGDGLWVGIKETASSR
ncbi:MAG: O-methyltransferase [Planctomycetota bacterium]